MRIWSSGNRVGGWVSGWSVYGLMSRNFTPYSSMSTKDFLHHIHSFAFIYSLSCSLAWTLLRAVIIIVSLGSCPTGLGSHRVSSLGDPFADSAEQ